MSGSLVPYQCGEIATDERVMAALEKKDCGQSALVDAVKARIGGVG